MKARIKATGEIVYVNPTYSLKDRNDNTIYYTDGKLGEWTASDLDFLPEKETAVLEGWAVRDKCGSLWLYDTRPSREYNYWAVTIDTDGIALPPALLPSVTWQSEPKRARITIEEIEE